MQVTFKLFATLMRHLPAAIVPYCIERESDAVYRLRQDARRALGAIALPVTAVKLEFFGFSRERFESFLRRYRRHMQKGGG